jgi:DNA polymerase-3 subunit alpha/error-prone DNA polymerase
MLIAVPTPASLLAVPRIRAGAAALGERLGRELAGWPLPLLAVQSHFSMLEGILPPAVWGDALRAFHAARGDDGGPWAVVADRNDLLALPACIEVWGRRVAVGASLLVRSGAVRGDGVDTEVLLLAPTPGAYRHLCRLLSWRHEHREQWQAWQDGDDRVTPDCSELIALVRDPGWLRRMREAGAEVHWRSGLVPETPPPGVLAVAAPLFSHVSPASMTSDPILAALRTRQAAGARPATPARVPRSACLTDLALMRRAYAGHLDQLQRGGELLARCTYVPGGSWHLPPADYGDAHRLLRQRSEAGFARRYGQVEAGHAARARARLEHELAVIRHKDFASYILTVADLAAGRRTCGRGSAASSLVCYALGLTNVDPIRYNLLFERFLSPDRVDPPDIDIDFPWDERDAVLSSAIATYGAERVAMVATHQYLRRWSALREVARAYGVPSDEISSARIALSRSERFGIPADLPPPWPSILAATDEVVGAPHHLGLHCGGIVITSEPIRDLVPVHPAAKEIALEPPGSPGHRPATVPLPAIAWEKDGAEAMGLVKIDLLGNRSLAVVRDCVRDLAEDGEVIDETTWEARAVGDEKTRAIVAAGDTIGCFYIESPAMRQLQAKAGSGDFDRLVVHSSIIRPAAMHWIDTYLQRFHAFRRDGVDRPEWYPHPALRDTLSESFGVLSYQEDVMLVAQRIAGFDSHGANQLRKALGHFDTTERLRPLADRFAAGARANGVPAAVTAELWKMIMSFSGYSFCKAHSASYAMVSFQCAWLKAHHPAHFFANVIANQGGFYHPAAYLEAARRLGIAIRGPCVMASSWLTRREGPLAIRCGLHLLPGISQRSAERLVAARAEAPFRSLRDLRRRAQVGAATLDALAICGALDALLPQADPAQRRWLAASVGLEPPARSSCERQTSWLEDALDPLADPEAPPLVPPTPRALGWQRYRALGFLPEAHPIALWGLPGRRVRCRDVVPSWKGRRTTIIAAPITSKQVDAHTKAKGDRPAGVEAMAFVTFEDDTGLLETVWFPAAYRAYGVLVDSGLPLRLHGRVEAAFGVVTFTVDRAEALALPEADQAGTLTTG